MNNKFDNCSICLALNSSLNNHRKNKSKKTIFFTHPHKKKPKQATK